MCVLYYLLHVNLEIRCKITKNVLYIQQFCAKSVLRAQQICVKSVLRTQQLYAKLNKNVIYQSFSIKTNTYRVTSERSDEIPASTLYTLHPTPKKRKQQRTTGANNITTRFSACNFET